MIIKLVIILFAAFALWRTYLRFRHKDIAGRELAVWAVFWLLVAIVTLVPKKTDLVAQWLGVERGADLLIYLSIIVLFFIVFKIIVKLEKIDRDITKVVRQTAIESEENRNQKTGNKD